MKGEEIDFGELSRKLKQGDRDAMRDVFQMYGAACISFIRSYASTCSKAQAEDIMMEAMLSLMEQALKQRLPEIQHVRNYLFTSCRNIYLKQEQKRKRPQEKQREIEDYYYDYLSAYPDQLWERQEQRKWQQVQKALERLGSKCRDLLKWFYMDKMSMADIAGRLGYASMQVAKTSKARCMKQLRQEVSEMSSLTDNDESHEFE